MHSIVSDFRIDSMMRYSRFVPRLYNLCLSLNFEAGNMMPSRAFCSDENQGFPVILIAKHFGAFPFNHGRVGGIVATSRHGPHAHHGKDMVIIQASHIGYDPQSKKFGQYRRLQTPELKTTTTCGKIGHVIQWYLDEHHYAQENIYLGREGDVHTITIDNQLLNQQRESGLILDIDKLVSFENGHKNHLHALSTSRVFRAADSLSNMIPEDSWPRRGRLPIGKILGPEMFSFRSETGRDSEQVNHLESNLISAMPWIVTAKIPMLVAAQVNTQQEFDRTFRSIVKEKEYRDKRLIFISCLNIDISPRQGQLFPLTKCIPWAAYIQTGDGHSQTLEQAEIIDLLMQQSSENPDQINLESAIRTMTEVEEITIEI